MRLNLSCKICTVSLFILVTYFPQCIIAGFEEAPEIPVEKETVIDESLGTECKEGNCEESTNEGLIKEDSIDDEALKNTIDEEVKDKQNNESDSTAVEEKDNSDELDAENATSSSNGTDAKVHCVTRVLWDDEVPMVKIMNGTSLLNALMPVPNVTNGECCVVLFYSSFCMFSAKAAPHFNALPRVYPQIYFYAIDAATYSSLNMRYGLVAVPTIMLFHNGRPVAKFNDSEAKVNKFANFITIHTGMTPINIPNVTTSDMFGPVPAVPSSRTDYYLLFAWLFTLACLCLLFARSSLCGRMLESIRNTWHEAEAQHEHLD